MPTTPTATRILVVVSLALWMFSGLARGENNVPRMLRRNTQGENLGTIEGFERESILKEFRFEKSSSSRLSTREDAFQHEDAFPPPATRDFVFSDPSEDETTEHESSQDLPRKEENLRRHSQVMKDR